MWVRGATVDVEIRFLPKAWAWLNRVKRCSGPWVRDLALLRQRPDRHLETTHAPTKHRVRKFQRPYLVTSLSAVR